MTSTDPVLGHRVLIRVSLMGVFLILCLGILSGSAVAGPTCSGDSSDFAGGDGSAETPYEIETVEQLQCIGEDDHLDDDFVLVDDINASETETWNDGDGFEPIGGGHVDNPSFSGSFDGNGYSIDDLFIDFERESSDDQRVGLFGFVGETGTVENGTVTNANVTSDAFRTGVVVGQNNGTVQHVTVTANGTFDGGRSGGVVGKNHGTVQYANVTVNITTSSTYIGGIVGRNLHGGIVSNSTVTASMNSTSGEIGGAVGRHSPTANSIQNVSASGTIEATGFRVGGLVGRSYAKIDASTASVSITTTGWTAGGLVGQLSSGSVTDSEATGDVHGEEGQSGGFSGFARGATITNSTASGNVSGTEFIGGFNGWDSNITTRNSSATGDVNGSDYVGGFHGYIDDQGGSVITDSYATGNVTATGDTVGGFAAHIEEAQISRTYTTGSVAGNDTVGGFVGENEADGTIEDSYWDLNETNQTEGYAINDGSVTNLTGLETAEMHGLDPAGTMSAFDFGGMWNLTEEYPRLAWEGFEGLPPVEDVDAENVTMTAGESDELVVTADDNEGNPIDDRAIEILDDDDLDGIAVGDTNETNASGVATFDLTETVADNYTVEVGWANDTSVDETATVTVEATDPDSVSVDPMDDSTTVSDTFGDGDELNYTVTVEDEFGNVVQESDVELTDDGDYLQVDGDSTQETDSDGNVTFTVQSNTSQEDVTLTFTELETATENNVTALATFDADDPVTVTVPNVTSESGVTGDIAITLTDEFDNPVPNESVEILDDADLDGLIVGATNTTNATGVTTFTFSEETVGEYSPTVGWEPDTSISDSLTVDVVEQRISEQAELNESGSYVLDTDLECSEPCIEVNASNVTIDGDGHALSADGPSADDYGLVVDGHDDVSLVDLQVRDWGISIEGSNTTVTNLDIGNSTAANTTLSFGGNGSVVANETPPSNPEGNESIGRYVEVNGTLTDVELQYESADVENVTASGLELWQYNGNWSQLASDVDTSTQVVTATEIEANATIGAFAPPLFDVSIDEKTSPVDAGETLVVNVTIENLGSVTDTQEIALLDFNGTDVDSTAVELAVGNDEQLSLEWNTSSDDAGEDNITVTSLGDEATTSVEIESDDDDGPVQGGGGAAQPPATDDEDDDEDVTDDDDETNDTDTTDDDTTDAADVTIVQTADGASTVTVENVGSGSTATIEVDTSDEESVLASSDSVQLNRLSLSLDTDRDFDMNFSSYDLSDIDSLGDLEDDVPEHVVETATAFETETETLATGYLDIDHSLADSEISEATVAFSIDRSLLEEIATDPEDVALYRDGNDGWDELPTEYTDSNETHYRFEATTPGFSVLSIGTGSSPIVVTEATLEEPLLSIDEESTVHATVTHFGFVETERTVAVLLDDEVVASDSVTLESGEEQSISISFVPETAGEYDMDVGEQSIGTVTIQQESSGLSMVFIAGLVPIVLLSGGVLMWAVYTRADSIRSFGRTLTAGSPDDPVTLDQVRISGELPAADTVEITLDQSDESPTHGGGRDTDTDTDTDTGERDATPSGTDTDPASTVTDSSGDAGTDAVDDAGSPASTGTADVGDLIDDPDSVDQATSTDTAGTADQPAEERSNPTIQKAQNTDRPETSVSITDVPSDRPVSLNDGEDEPLVQSDSVIVDDVSIASSDGGDVTVNVRSVDEPDSDSVPALDSTTDSVRSIGYVEVELDLAGTAEAAISTSVPAAVLAESDLDRSDLQLYYFSEGTWCPLTAEEDSEDGGDGFETAVRETEQIRAEKKANPFEFVDETSNESGDRTGAVDSPDGDVSAAEVDDTSTDTNVEGTQPDINTLSTPESGVVTFAIGAPIEQNLE